MSQTPPVPEGDIQRWTAKRKAAVVLDQIRGKTTPPDAARQHGLTVAEIEQWKEDFLSQGTEALRSHPRDREAQWEAEKQRLQAKVGGGRTKKSASHSRQGLAGRDLVNAVRCDALESGLEIPLARLCRILGVPRSTTYHQPRIERLHRPVDEALAKTVHQIIQAHPTYGIRRVWAWLKHRLDQPTNRRKVHRLMRIKGWTMRQRAVGKRSRVPGSRSIAPHLNQRWSTDIALVDCGIDGWCAFAPVLDCCTREVLGWSLDRTARTKLVERALEDALIHRFGWTHGAPRGLILRHDNGLVFGSRAYRALVKDYGLKQEYITPYTLEQNGLCERFIRSFKEECAWLDTFQNIQEARASVARYIDHYNTQRPHQALAYRTPQQAFLNPQPAA